MIEQPERKNFLNRPLNKWVIVLLFCGAFVVFTYLVVSGPSFHQQIQQSMALDAVARVTKVTGDLELFNTALRRYRNDVKCKQYPTTTLMQLVSDTAIGWTGPYMATITNDPWNNQYAYTSNGTTYTISSVHMNYAESKAVSYISNGSDTANAIERIQ